MSLTPGPPPVSILPSSSPHTHIRSPITLITHERPTQTSGVSNGQSQQNPGNPMASAALYLYTFLATLILLVGISLFIVIRSIVQRRRRNRAVHEAWLRYTNGSIPFREGDLDLIRFVEFRMNQAGFTPRSGRIDLSKVPRMWEVNIAPKKSIDSEKTAEGKLISSSWKSNQLSNPHLDLKSSSSPSWVWSSILPLSSTPLLDQTTASNEDGTTPGSAAMPVNPNGRRNMPLSGVRRFLGMILHGSGSAPSPGRDEFDQSRPNAPASASESPSETGNNPNANPIDSVDGTAPSSSRSEDRNRNRTGTDIQLEEGNIHVHGSDGSNSVSNSQPQPYNSNTTDPSINHMPPTTVTSTTIEMAESSSTHQQPGQRGGEVYVSHKFPSNRYPCRNSNQPPNHHPFTPNEQKIPSGPGTDINVNETIQMRVAVLVRMPTPPTTSSSSSTPLSHSGLSKAESKAKAKVELGYELKDEKRLSPPLKSLVSTLGGGENKDDMDADGVQVPSLEVGLADVDVFLDCQGGEGWREMSSEWGER